MIKTTRAEAVPRRKQGKPAGAFRPDGLRAGTKLALLADTVCRPQGATHAELCEVVGWTTCLPMTMKACETAGVTLRREKEGRQTRYFGTPKAR